MSEECCEQQRNAEKPKKAFKETPAPVETRLSWECGAQKIGYVARAGHVQIRENDGEPIGSLFTVSYTAEDGDANRPVTFCFNGGPGSASVLINVGGLGPRRVVPNGDRRIGPAPYAIEDNPNTLLKVSDLVFIDALGTGWSKLADGVEPQRAYGVDKDADCFARCIAAWLEETGRWNAPLYLFGESYGTTRNAVLCRELESTWNIGLNGVVMLSAIFDWSATIPGNDANYVQLLPTFAAIAQYFDLCPAGAGKTPDELFGAAIDFAETQLAPALLLGDRLPADREAELAAQMASFVGLDAAYLARKHLRVELTDFRQELLKGQNLVCGRLDGRFTYEAGNFLQTSAEGQPADDPSDAATMAAWAAGFRTVMSEIGYRNPVPYTMSSWATVGQGWDHTHTSAGAAWKAKTPNVAYDLAETMRHNPYMKVLVLGGRYDLATPFLGPVQDMARMFLGADIKKNLSWHLYDAGHMIYVNPSAFDKMAADVEAFYQA